MANVGMGIEGEKREETQRGFWWLNDRRKGWESEDEQKDRTWVRTSREGTRVKSDSMRQIVISVVAAALGAAFLWIIGHVGIKP